MTGSDTGFYASDSLHVAIYDAMATDVPGGDDIAFFRSLAEQTGGPALELGCGTGRVAIPLAEGGFDVTGIDRSAAMLARSAKARSPPARGAGRLRFVEATSRTCRAGEAFGLIFAAYRVFMSVLEPEDQLGRSRLSTGGSGLKDPRDRPVRSAL